MATNPKKSNFNKSDFREQLAIELTKADRGGYELTLITFESLSKNEADSIKLHNMIQSKCRAGDLVGYIDRFTPTVLLFFADQTGTSAFISKIKTEDQSLMENFSISIKNYPKDWKNPDFKQDRKSEATRPAKKMMDVTISLLMILTLSPIFLFAFLLIKATSKGPALFRQERVGLHGKTFTLLKFRTMTSGNNQDDHKAYAQQFIANNNSMNKLDTSGDKRIIPGGKLLRASCIDELPQLFNVLKGEMSLIGPRPCIPYEAEVYKPWYNQRFNAHPGLTGLWQVSGKNKLTFEEMIRLDIAYAKRQNLLLDLKILFKTPIVVLQLLWEGIRPSKNNKIKRKSKVTSVKPLGVES